MPRVTFVATCMGRLSFLRQSLPTWIVQPDSEVVVVDYTCPDRSGAWVEAQHPGARVIRVPGQPRFNLAAARNAGAAAARGAWLAFVDADILLAPDFGAAVFPGLAGSGYWLADGGATDLQGTVLVPRADFEAVGGYDEALEGWGGEDGDLYRRLRWRGLACGTFPHARMRSLPHGDDLRVAHAALADREINWLVNRAYLEAKWTFMRLQERDLELPERRDLYAHVRDTLLAALERCELPALEFSLGWKRIITGMEFEHRFTLGLRHAPPGAG